jgi:hypothetical protein
MLTAPESFESERPKSSFDVVAYKPDCSTEAGARQLAAAGQFIDGRLGKREKLGDLIGGHDVGAGE